MATTLGAAWILFFLVHPHVLNSSGWILLKTGASSSVSCAAKLSALTCKIED